MGVIVCWRSYPQVLRVHDEYKDLPSVTTTYLATSPITLFGTKF
jgi:hypothetical protein